MADGHLGGIYGALILWIFMIRKGRFQMPVIHHVADMITKARATVSQVTVHEAAEMHRNDQAELIDIRDIRELYRAGTIPDAFHAPRGMLEFWVDPESPYHKPVFRTDKTLILFCASGLRSALAAQTWMQMGLADVKDMQGGFTEWKMQGLTVEPLPQRTVQ